MSKEVLIVDDSPELLFTVKDGLENCSDFNITCLDDGKKCLDYLNNNPPPDIILLDIMMPEMSGWQVLKEIKKIDKLNTIPIVFLTAKNDNFTKSYGKLSASYFLEKPFTIEELKKIINTLLNNPMNESSLRKKIMQNLIDSIP